MTDYELPRGLVAALCATIARAYWHHHRWAKWVIPYWLYLKAGDVWIDRYIEANR